SFKTYEIINEAGDLSFKNNIFSLHRVNGGTESNFGNWTKIETNELNGLEKESFEFRKLEQTAVEKPIQELPISFEIEEVEKITKEESTITNIKYENTLVQNKLYNIIKEKKL